MARVIYMPAWRTHELEGWRGGQGTAFVGPGGRGAGSWRALYTAKLLVRRGDGGRGCI